MNKLEFESYLWSVSIFYYDKKKERQRWRRLSALLCSSEFSNGKTHTHTQQELMSIWVFRCVFATDLKARTNKSKQSNKIKLKAKQKKKKEKNLIEIIINLQSTLNKIFFLFTLLVSSARAHAREIIMQIQITNSILLLNGRCIRTFFLWLKMKQWPEHYGIIIIWWHLLCSGAGFLDFRNE